MSKLDEWIQKFCPNGVEFRRLDEIFHTRNGYTPSKSNPSYWNGDTCIPWFRMEDIREHGNILTDSIQHITPAAVKGELFPENSIIVATSATIGEHALIKVKSLANQRFTYLVLKEKYQYCYDIKFLYYYCYKLDEWCLIHLNQSNFASVDMGKFYAFTFPIPPLAVQREIVRILDNFTELTEELTKELAARKKQYEYYRDSLLTFDTFGGVNNAGWFETELGDIGKVSMCKRIMKTETSNEGEIPFYKIRTFGKEADSFITREKYEKYKKAYSFPNKGDILISASGTIGRVVVYNGEDAYYQDSNIVWLAHDESVVLNKYLYYFYQLQPWKVSTGGTIIRLYNENIRKTKIVIPTMEEQKRIVEILDYFDDLCSNLSTGLPAEIEARKKQYEYYRDKLLTFKE